MASTDTETQLLGQGTWNIDPAHSSMQFSVRHLMISKVKGSFTKFEGTVTVPENPFEAVARRHLRPCVDRHRRPEGRDGHLRSADFFEVEKYPHGSIQRRRRPARRATTTWSRAPSTFTA